jgi:serine/threonine-protein kinase SRPK3
VLSDFDDEGELRRISKLKFWPLENVFGEKYDFSEEDRKETADFLLRMLVILPQDRATAQQMLQHPWLRNV